MFQLFALVLRNADKSTVRLFIPCSARNFCKGAKFAGSVGHPMTKMLSASGGLRPPDQGLCPWTPLGALPPDPRYTLVLRTRHGAPKTLTPSTASDPRASSPLLILTSLRLCILNNTADTSPNLFKESKYVIKTIKMVVRHNRRPTRTELKSFPSLGLFSLRLTFKNIFLALLQSFSDMYEPVYPR